MAMAESEPSSSPYMPPIGCNIIDKSGVELVTAWILHDLKSAPANPH